MRPDPGDLARGVTQYLGIGLMVISCPVGVGHRLSISLLFGTIISDLQLMTAARNVRQRLPSYPFSYQKFSFGNTGRVCKTLQTILRDKKVEFCVT